MSFFYLGALFLILFLISFFIDKRRFRNGVYLLFALGSFYMELAVSRNTVILAAAMILVIVAFFAVVVVSGFFVYFGCVTLKKEGLSLKNAVPIFFVLWVWGVFALMLYMMLVNRLQLWMSLLFILVGMMFFVFCITFSSFFLYSELYNFYPKGKHCDYVLIHGAGLMGGTTVTPLLAKRVDKGIEVYKRSGCKAKVVVSGGQGRDEKVSEASAMAAYAISKGVPKEALILEDHSTTTYENMKYSKELMDIDSQGKKYRCIFVTNNYHVFRTGIYAKKVKLKAEGVGCKTAAYYWPGAFIREYVALMVRYKWVFILTLLLWLALSAVATKGVYW